MGLPGMPQLVERSDDFAGRRMRPNRARSYGDVDWGAIITAGANLTTGIVNTVAKVNQANSQTNTGQTYQCPAGYLFDQTRMTCTPPVGSAQAAIAPGGSSQLIPGIDNTMLLLGAGGLVAAILLLKK